MSFFASIYRQISALDLDEIFSYQTTKEVRMLDVRLGIVCWVIRIIVLIYVVGYVFLLNQGYTESEKSVGHMLSSVNGSTYSTDSGVIRPWDAIDAVQPAMENGAAFVATTIYVTAGQAIGNFSNPELPCTTSSDCLYSPPLSYGVCYSNQCAQYGWQPPFSDTDSHTQMNELVGADTFGIWMTGSIQFPALDSARIFSTMDAAAPTPYAGGSGPGGTKTDVSTSSSTVGDGTTAAPDYYTVCACASCFSNHSRMMHAS